MDSIVIYVELQADDPRVERLLHLGLSRARQHVVLIVTAKVARRLGKMSA